MLERIERGDLSGCISAAVLAELAHRLMTIEVANRLNRPLTGIASWLRRHPSDIKVCRAHRRAIDELALIPLTILPIDGLLMSRAADLSIQFGLLTNDALIVAVMLGHGLDALASMDSDFDRVPAIVRYAPI